MKAFITLLSTVDYLSTVLLMNEDFQRINSQYPFVAAVTDDIYDEVQDTLNKANCKKEKIEKISYGSKTIPYIKNKFEKKDWRVLNTAPKIELFKLTQYDKLIYLDADTKVFRNIDDLFDYPDGSMLIPSGEENIGGHTALMVFSPKNHDHDFYRQIINNLICADGDMFGKLWFQCRSDEKYKIPYYYMMSSREHITNEDLEILKTITYGNSPKPWDKGYQPANIFERKYVRDLKEISEKYNIT